MARAEAVCALAQEHQIRIIVGIEPGKTEDITGFGQSPPFAGKGQCPSGSEAFKERAVPLWQRAEMQRVLHETGLTSSCASFQGNLI